MDKTQASTPNSWPDGWDAVATSVSPAALRNAPLILAVIGEQLAVHHVPRAGTVLETASGAGYHAAVCAHGLPQYRWQPSEADAAGRALVDERVDLAALPNLMHALVLDVTSEPWPVDRADAVLCINMIHISPWKATLGLIAGAARLLPAGAPLITYGPYLINGDYQADSNRIFDQSLRTRNPSWGLREVADIVSVAEDNFDHVAEIPMPANNHILVFKRRG